MSFDSLYEEADARLRNGETLTEELAFIFIADWLAGETDDHYDGETLHERSRLDQQYEITLRLKPRQLER